MRTWLRIDAAGESSTLEADKYALAHQLAVPLRDLRILDPNISTAPASALLVRERALVVNMEAVKAIITADQVLLLNAEDSSEFVEEMRGRVRGTHRSGADGHGGGGASAGPSGAKQAGSQAGESTTTELPFELRALEVCLEAVSTLLERAYGELEAAAHPALDALTVKVGALTRVKGGGGGCAAAGRRILCAPSLPPSSPSDLRGITATITTTHWSSR